MNGEYRGSRLARENRMDLHGISIALVCPYAWTTPGGVQTHVAGLAAELRRRGAVVDVLAPADGPVDVPRFVSLGRSIGFTWQGTVTRVTLTPAAVWRTARAMRGLDYDLVHIHEPMLPAAGLTAVLAASCPVVATFHMTARSALWYRVFLPVVRLAARRLAARIAVSEHARSFAERVLPGNYRVIPNAIDFVAQSHKVHRAENGGPFRILFVGRPDPRKGLPVLLRAFERLPGDTVLDLVGVTPKEIVAQSHKVIRAHGRVSDGERARLMGEADVLCAPSLGGESFGIVLVEGMAAGLPVVATAIPGYEAVLPPDAGRLVPPGDEAALAAALGELLDDPQLRGRMGEAGRREAARYDWSRVGDEIVAVYGEVLR
jgi:phosphatidylinositol alpha-mannosyltransferase